jgi:YesN/AraC family two-component response regulator
VEEAVHQLLSPVDQVIQYIEKTPPGEVTLGDAAKRVHMNASYLSQLFKHQMNINFVDYVTELRIKEAKKLLCNTSLRVSEIADRMGYSDVAYFCTIFKRMTGCTPSEYRKS